MTTLTIKLSWATLTSEYKRIDSYGSLTMPLKKPGVRAGYAPKRDRKPAQRRRG